MVISAYIVPHPPIIVPEVGRGEEAKISATTAAFMKVAGDIGSLAPDTVIVISPHSTVYYDYFHISPGEHAVSDLSRFGAGKVRIEAGYDTEFVKELATVAESSGIPAGTLGEKDASLDHGTQIPLYFINKTYTAYKLVRIGISGMDPLKHYQMGKAIAATAEKLGRRTVIVASGDLSHKLKADGPYGFAPEGPEFDNLLLKVAADADFIKLMEIDPAMANNAAECGLRSFIIMAGALDGKSVKSELLSYEGPFGVGYAVSIFHVTGADPSRRFDIKYRDNYKKKLSDIRANEDVYLNFARKIVESYVSGMPDIDIPVDLPAEMTSCKAGVFVSIKKRGELRGCIGTIKPVTGSIAEEILRNAKAASSEDPRFSPVSPDELELLTYSVDILGDPEPTDFEGLDSVRYGVIVTSGHKRGLLLPNLDGVDTPEQQVYIAMGKAGISPAENYSLERFEVVRHK